VPRSVRIGTSGWNYRDWRGSLYPRGLATKHWLECYATVFDTVEVNATFYRLPTEATVGRWVEQTPPNFLFAVKGSRYLTHIKRLAETGTGVERFFAVLEPLRRSGKLGPVLWQLPPSFHRDDDRLASFLDGLPPSRHCVELRHPSWFANDVFALLAERGVGLVVGDDPGRPFQLRRLTADWTYVRFHRGATAEGNYSPAELARWRRRIAAWSARAEVYGYFNNDWLGYAVEDALELRRSFARR
jgi:uncharacterized protein YecE (DUF72 family)